MTFKNRQMRTENMLKGVRGCMVWVTYAKAFKGITWENAKDRFINNMEYGWTRFPDVLIIMYFIKNYFVMRRTHVEIGYACRTSKTGNNLDKRLRRLNVLSILEVFNAMVDNGLVSKTHLKPVLEQNIPKEKGGLKRPGRVYSTPIFRFYTKSLITDALAKANAPKIQNVAKQFDVTQKIVRYWANKEVEDIRVQSMD